MDLAVQSCSEGFGVPTACGVFCGTTDALIVGAVAVSGALNPLSDAAAALIGAEYATGCEVACVGSLGTACASVALNKMSLSAVSATAAAGFCATVIQ